MNPETFSGDQPLGQPAILLSLSPREKGSYPWFPFGTSIGIYDYFTYFSQFCKREKTGIQSKFHDCSKFIRRNHRSFSVFYIGIYASEDGNQKQ